MSSEREEVDPIKTNPDSHKAIGVAAMIVVLVGLGWWLRGSPFSTRRTECQKPADVGYIGTGGAADSGGRGADPAESKSGCCPYPGENQVTESSEEPPAED